MSEPPTLRTTTIMFIDQVASTSMLTEIGDGAFTAVHRRYNEVVRRALADHGGTEVKSTGDGTLAFFDSATGAVSTAAAIQQTMAAHRSAGERQPLLRIGLALGDCRFEDGDVFGSAVVLASRLCDLAPADEILVTDLVATLAQASNVETGEVAATDVKGWPEPLATRLLRWRTATAPGLPLPGLLTFDRVFTFVGRQAELDVVAEQYDGCLAGELTAVVVEGEPGVGKTRLVSAAVESLHRGGAVVLAGRCDEHQPTALQPVTEWLHFVIAHTAPERLVESLGPGVAHLARLVPELALAVPNGDAEPAAPGDRYQLYRAVAQWLSAMSADRPVIVVVDDLQWATASTAELLSALASTPALGRVLLLCTRRDTEAAPNPAVADLITLLHRTTRVREVPVTGLDVAEVEGLLSAAAGRPLEPHEQAAIAPIAQATGGNPLFVTELVRHLTETEAIASVDDRLQLVIDPADLKIPSSIRSIVDQRVRRMGSEATRVLQAAAVVGARFEPWLIGEMLELDDDSVDEVLATTLDTRLVVEPPDGGRALEFSHALVRHTLYGSINSRRRAQLHRSAARCLERSLRTPTDDRVLEVAHHWLHAASGDSDQLVAVYRRAGDHATGRLDHATAHRWYGQALEVLEADATPSDPRHVALLIALGEAAKRAGLEGFREPLMRAATRARDHGDHEARRAALLATHRGVYSSAGRVNSELVDALEEMLNDTPEDDVGTRALVGGVLASELTWHPDLDRKLRAARMAEDHARRHGDPSVVAHVLHCTFDVFELAESGIDLMRRAQELLDLGDALHDDHERYFGGLLLATSALTAGDLDRARYAIDRAYDALSRLAEPILESHLTGRPASLLIATGQFAEGLAIAERGLQLRLDTKQPEAVMVYAAHQFEWLRHMGRLGEVEELIAAAVEEDSTLRVYAAALAIIYCNSGRPHDAQRLWDDLTGGDVLIMLEGVQSVLTTMSVAAELIFELGDTASADVLLPLVDARREDFAVSGPSFRGPMTTYLALLHATLGHHDEAQRWFTHSIEACDRLGIDAEGVHVRLFAARHLLTIGHSTDAARVATDAAAAATRLGMDGLLHVATAMLETPNHQRQDAET